MPPSSILEARRKPDLPLRNPTRGPTSSRIRSQLTEVSRGSPGERQAPTREVLMRGVQMDDTGSSKGLREQHPTGESPRLQSVAPTESPYQRGRCYSAHVTDALLTFFLSEVSQPCRWAFALPSCTFELREIPPEGSLTRLSRCFKVSIRQSPGRTPRSSPNLHEAVHLLPSLPNLCAAPPNQQAGLKNSAQESAARAQPPQSGT